MTLFNIITLRANLQPNQRLLGIDPGSKVIGLALSDVSLMLATPFGHVKRDKLTKIATYIRNIAQEEQIGGMIIGLPLSMDGREGPAAQAAKHWAEELSLRTKIPASMWDERLSTKAINRFLITEVDMSRKRRNEVVNKMAAAYILQAALDSFS